VTTFSVSQVSHYISITKSLGQLDIFARDFAVYNHPPARTVLQFLLSGISFVAISSPRRQQQQKLG